MTKLIPTRNSCLSKMTSGEKRFSERLEQKLEDDYLCWFNVPIGPLQRQPDFVVAHPRRGFLVLEVKDWKLDTIQEANRQSFRILTDRGLTSVANPMGQARVYALEVAVTLEKDPALRQVAGSKHENKLIMPYGWGVVLSNITRRQFEANNLGEVLESHLVICQDEMTESVDVEAFQKRLWDMFRFTFPCTLTLPQMDRIRWHMFPEIRVPQTSGQFGLFQAKDSVVGEVEIPNIIRIMDMQQEQLARSMGEGHRVIHGVAGSGKTMILGYRCIRMARALSKPILVLCYNVTLAARLRQLIDAHGIADRVCIRSFHAWCREMLTSYSVSLPPKGRGFFDGLVTQVIRGVDLGQIPRAQYGAVLVDEGHDFQPEWFKLIVQMVDPETNSLLVLYDDAQAIYSKETKTKFTFSSVGIKAQGRTTILKMNYRNTVEILTVARAFASELLVGADADDDNVPVLAPESGGRRGDTPSVVKFNSLSDELQFITAKIKDEQDRGRPLSDMAIIYRSDEVASQIERALAKQGVHFSSAQSMDGKRKLYEDPDSLKVVSMHSSKGLEFGSVFIPGLGQLPHKNEPEHDEARLLYVAMTRATEKLTLTYNSESIFSKKIFGAVEKLNLSGTGMPSL